MNKRVPILASLVLATSALVAAPRAQSAQEIRAERLRNSGQPNYHVYSKPVQTTSNPARTIFQVNEGNTHLFLEDLGSDNTLDNVIVDRGKESSVYNRDIPQAYANFFQQGLSEHVKGITSDCLSAVRNDSAALLIGKSPEGSVYSSGYFKVLAEGKEYFLEGGNTDENSPLNTQGYTLRVRKAGERSWEFNAVRVMPGNPLYESIEGLAKSLASIEESRNGNLMDKILGNLRNN